MNWIKRTKNKLAFFAILVFAMFGVSTELNDFEISKNLEIFSNIYQELNTYYADEIDPEYLMETGANAMLQSLDPYTTFISKEDVEEFNSSISGKYGGIGSTIFQKEGYIYIAMPYENSPAEKAGLMAGDKVLSVDGKSMHHVNMNDIGNYMRGEPNTAVKMEVARYGVEKPIKVTLTRAEIKVNNTPYVGMLAGDIGYINLSTFSENAGENVANALQNLKANNTLKGVVLDLRGNTGGLLMEAVNVVNVFVKKGSVVTKIKGRDKARDRVYRTLNPSVDTKIPLVVLINGGSASASEIVAGAIQDYDRGVIVGERSFGKGLVQNMRDLPSGAKIKFTTARYYIPSNRSIQALAYENGKPKRIADSLRVAYATANGRKVYDGGGINPDVVIDRKAFYAIQEALLKENYAFDFAIKYHSEHATIAPMEQFELTDQDFEDYLAFVKKRGFNYQTDTEKLLDNLEQKAAKDNYTELLKEELASIQQVVNRTGEQEINAQKKHILNQLQAQIAATYYARKGAVAGGLRGNAEIEEALKVLNDNERYYQILGR